MGDWHGPGTLFARWHSLSRVYLLVAFLMVAFCPLALVSKRPVEGVMALLIAARIFYLIGKHFSDSAKLAMIGAIGEDDVAAVLQALPSNWKVERNIVIESGGDIDFLVTAPDQTIYLLDVKAHKGTVSFDGVRLVRKVGEKKVSFEKDFLSKVKQQAVQIRTERKLPFVHTMVVFTRARVETQSQVIPLVRVVALKDLLPFLLAAQKEIRPKISVRPHLTLVAEKVLPSSQKALSQSAQLKHIAREAGIVPLDRNYSIRLHDCWNCKNRIFVLDWPEHEMWDRRLPPDPVPNTIQLRYSQASGTEYWANTCFLCGQVQGDIYVFANDSPYKWYSSQAQLMKTPG